MYPIDQDGAVKLLFVLSSTKYIYGLQIVKRLSSIVKQPQFYRIHFCKKLVSFFELQKLKKLVYLVQLLLADIKGTVPNLKKDIETFNLGRQANTLARSGGFLCQKTKGKNY